MLTADEGVLRAEKERENVESESGGGANTRLRRRDDFHELERRRSAGKHSPESRLCGQGQGESPWQACSVKVLPANTVLHALSRDASPEAVESHPILSVSYLASSKFLRFHGDV